MHNFLCQNVWTFPLYTLLPKKINKFWSNGIDKVWSGGIQRSFGLKEEKTVKFLTIFELYQVFIRPKMFRYLQIVFY